MPYRKGDHRGDLYLTINLEYPSEHWLSKPQNIDQLVKILPKSTAKLLEADLVDNVDFEADASIDTVSRLCLEASTVLILSSLAITIPMAVPLGLTMTMTATMTMVPKVHSVLSSKSSALSW